MHQHHEPISEPRHASTHLFSYGTGIFGRRIECHQIDNEFFLYGVTASGDPRVPLSLGMAREGVVEDAVVLAAPLRSIGVVDVVGRIGKAHVH